MGIAEGHIFLEVSFFLLSLLYFLNARACSEIVSNLAQHILLPGLDFSENQPVVMSQKANSKCTHSWCFNICYVLHAVCFSEGIAFI